MDDGGIDNRASRQLQAALFQVLVHALEPRRVQIAPLQQVAELAERGLVRHRFAAQLNVHEPTHREAVIQRFLRPRVRQVEPLLQEVDPQHPLQIPGTPPWPGFGYSGSLSVQSSSHGTTRPISVRNVARRAGSLWRSNPAVAKVARRIVTVPC